MASTPAALITITVEPGKSYQTIENFGASGAWWAQEIGGWEPDARAEVVRLLFDVTDGIGLSLYRYNIGGGANEEIRDPWRRSESFGTAPGQYDWSRDANAVRILKEIHAAGVAQFVVFANSPPAWMTRSGYASGALDGTTNLDPEQYDAFAQYLVDVVEHLRTVERVPIGWLSPINEPQWDWNPDKGQEGAHYTPQEVVAVGRALLEAVQAAGLDVRLSLPEAGEWRTAPIFYAPILRDPQLAPALDHIAIHSYWSEADDKREIAARLAELRPGLKVWMSEWTEMQEGVDTGMHSAMELANVVHDDLTLANVSSWQYWIAVSKYNYRDGLLYVQNGAEAVQQTKRLWALGNFSRYVRPGDRRVAASVDDSPLKVSAFCAAEGGKLTLVVLNNESERVHVRFQVEGAQVTPAAAFETSAKADLAPVAEVGAVVALAPRSVTTFLLERSSCR